MDTSAESRTLRPKNWSGPTPIEAAVQATLRDARESTGDTVETAYRRGYEDGVDAAHPFAALFVGMLAGGILAHVVTRIFL
jgi:hypothetical protein